MEPLGYLGYYLFLISAWITLILLLLLWKISWIYQQFKQGKIKQGKKIKTFWWDWLLIAYFLGSVAMVLWGFFFATSYEKIEKIASILLLSASAFLLVSWFFFYFQKFSWLDLLVFSALLISIFLLLTI